MRPSLAAAVLAAALLGCGDGKTPLVVYSPHGRDLLQLMERSFEERHPEVDVRWLDMGSQEVYDRLRSEAANPQADVWFGGPQTIFVRGAREGLLAPFRPSWAGAVPERSRDPRDLYLASYRTAPVLVYNAAVVPAAEAPRDWGDLLDPRWRKQVLIRDPLASGTMRILFGMVLALSVQETGSEETGWQFLRRLDAQTKEYVLNPALLLEKLNRREGLITVWELTDMLWQQKRGSPLAFTFPASGTPVIDDSLGLVRGARHPEPARAFIEWVGSEEAQLLAAREAFRLPARTDIPPAPDGTRPAPPRGPAREEVAGDVPAPRIYIAQRTHPFGSAEYDAVTVLATILGNGRGSRLYQRLADGARLAQPDYVSAYGVDLAHAPAPLIVTATARDGVPAADLEAGLVDVLDGLADISQEELDRAKALLATSWWRQVSTVAGRADVLSRYATQFGDPARAGDRLPAWQAVTLDAVAEAAASLRPESRVTLSYLTEESA